MHQQKPLFSFSLRIEKQMTKLSIYQDDNLEGVLERFGKLVKLKQNFQYRIKEKLENQLRKFVIKQECSDKVREKIESFLEESKVVIIGISQTEHYEGPVKQRPTKVQQESYRPTMRREKEQIKLSQPAGHDASPALKKYSSKEILVEQSQEKKYIYEIAQKTAKRQRNNNNYTKFLQPSQNYDQNYVTSGFDIRIETESLADIDRIIKNRIARSQQRQLRADVAICENKRKFSATPAQNKYDQPKLTSYESYQSYKQSKRDNYIIKQPSRQFVNTYNTQTNQYPQPSQSTNTIKHQPKNDISSKFDYEKCLQAKGVTVGSKQNQKFRYIS